MIKVTRREAFLFSPLAYEVFINGISHGKLNQNETKTFPAEYGRYSLHVKIDGYKGPSSHTLDVDVMDSTVHVEIVFALTWWWLVVPVTVCLALGLLLLSMDVLQNPRVLIFATGIGCLIGGLSSMIFFRGKYLRIKQIDTHV